MERKPHEDGYILLGVLILLALFVIAMAVAVPRIAASIQRDREVETMYRGKQYIRAIQLYYRKFNAYPPSIDALVKTNEIRFLRKRYLDPMTGKDDWKTIQYCQNKAPIAMGFFGQPLGPTSGCGPIAGIGPSGGNGVNGGSSLFPGQDQSGQQPGAQQGPTQQIGGPQAGGPQPGGQQPGGPQGAGFPSTNGSDPNGNGSTGMFGDNNNGGGQTFGGGGIIGVSPRRRQEIHPHLQEEGPLQPVGVHLLASDGPATDDDGRWQRGSHGPDEPDWRPAGWRSQWRGLPWRPRRL